MPDFEIKDMCKGCSKQIKDIKGCGAFKDFPSMYVRAGMCPMNATVAAKTEKVRVGQQKQGKKE